MNTRRAAAALLAVSSVGDLAGVVHQLLSHDRPPAAAMVVGAIVGVVGLVMVGPLLQGRTYARWGGFATRVLDVVLIGGAALSGHVFSEDCANSIPAVTQFLVSLVSAITLVALESMDSVESADSAVVIPTAGDQA